MSLAILKVVDTGNDSVNFKIDTGTNKYYYLNIGRSITETNGAKWVDDIFAKTPLKENKNSTSLFDSSINEILNKNWFKADKCYVQLFSFKNKEGKSPDYSRIVKINTGIARPGKNAVSFSVDNPVNSINMPSIEINSFRNIPHQDAASGYAVQSSFEDILSGLVKVAGPVVLGLLNSLQHNGTTEGGGKAGEPMQALGMFNTILDALLKGFQQPANGSSSPVKSQSVSQPFSFSGNREQDFSRPFIFGIDDAIIASLAGPVLQLIPQLLTASNQQKLQNKQANNKLVTDLMGDINRRLMLQSFLQNQAATAAKLPNGIDMNQLLQLLQQVPGFNGTTPAATVTAQGLSVNDYTHTLSDKTILTFEQGPKQLFFGKERCIYKSNADIKLRLKFNVTEPVPKAPLPKAIITIIFKGEKQNTLFEKMFKQKNISANSIQELFFSSAELSKMPVNTCIDVFAEMRWLTSQQREYKTLGNTEIIFTPGYFIKEQGRMLDDPRELTDMNAYRSFWNKVWESPVIDKLNENNNGYKKYGWELDGKLKYTVLLSAEHDSNGLMNTKNLVAAGDPESLNEIIAARMKGGIELSIGELNKMSTLWDKKQPLPNEKLAAFKSTYLVQQNTGEFIFTIKLKGKKAERGLIWVIPVLKLCNFSLSKIKTVTETGQVTETQQEEVQFPMPYAARVLGLKSI